MTTSFVERNLQRLKNVREYCREIGLPGTISLVRQKVAHVPVFELKVRGIDTPVFCRAQGSDFAVLRQVLGHQTLHMALHYSRLASVDVARAYRRASPVDALVIE